MDLSLVAMAMAHSHGADPGMAHMMAAMQRLMAAHNPGMAHMMAAMQRLMAAHNPGMARMMAAMG